MTPLPPSTDQIECRAPIATDGDSIRCADGTRLRLSMADAPDYRRSGRCSPRPKRDAWCDDVAAAKAKRSLASLMAGKRVTYTVVDANPCVKGFQHDPYAYRGRVVAVVYAGGVSLGPVQIATGNAKRWRCR